MRDRNAMTWHEDGLLAWDARGRIVACDAYKALRPHLPPTLACEDWSGHLILPGFVDCHTHLPQMDCRNKSGYTLLDWLERYIFPAEAGFADPDIARTTARRFFRALLAHGTTTAMIHVTIHESATDIAFEEAERAGLRAIIGKVMMDQHSPASLLERTREALGAAERLIAKWHGRHGRLFYAVTPRFALTCSRTLLAEAGRMAARDGIYFQTHLGETPEEVARTRDLHAVADPLALYEACGCVGEHALFAHTIHLAADEWRRLAAAGAAIAHCPSSNLFLRSGRMPYEMAVQHGVRCGLGSDVGAGPEFSLWDVMQRGAESHPPEIFPPLEAWYLATRGGAQVLGLHERVGMLAPGSAADFAIYPHDVRGVPPDCWLPAMMTEWRRHPVRATYVRGERRYTSTTEEG
ncbi:MAG: guanine deaminase [Deltaproteobacteria bacterium]|nr:guanine deaminase [Deltaproteobacteria bacterium]